jgi:16S rRNA (adenine1518-N6/adenine1519-N6)-dimethyltransferase
VIEIGPGRGSLTDILRERAGKVVAIEYDRALAALLREKYAADPAVRVVEADVLETNFGALADGPYALIGNVPYYITTPILFQALAPPRASRAVFLVQREVADRMVARAGDDAYGALSVNLQAIASVESVFRVPAGAFSPPPKVDSAVVRVTPLEAPLIAAGEERAFRTLVQAAFGMRRKQMRRVVRELKPMSIEEAERLLASMGIEPTARPETLEPSRFVAVLRSMFRG